MSRCCQIISKANHFQWDFSIPIGSSLPYNITLGKQLQKFLQLGIFSSHFKNCALGLDFFLRQFCLKFSCWLKILFKTISYIFIESIAFYQYISSNNVTYLLLRYFHYPTIFVFFYLMAYFSHG